jgi:hypothetical protein
VTPKWYQFGEAAGIHTDVLDSFAKQCSPEDCIMEMLDYWLRKHVTQPTWTDVANVLKHINLPQLASEIERIEITGMYFWCLDKKKHVCVSQCQQKRLNSMGRGGDHDSA